MRSPIYFQIIADNDNRCNMGYVQTSILKCYLQYARLPPCTESSSPYTKKRTFFDVRFNVNFLFIIRKICVIIDFFRLNIKVRCAFFFHFVNRKGANSHRFGQIPRKITAEHSIEFRLFAVHKITSPFCRIYEFLTTEALLPDL